LIFGFFAEKFPVVARLVFADFRAFLRGVREKQVGKRWFLRGNNVVASAKSWSLTDLI
jgi:hypothetical protein